VVLHDGKMNQQLFWQLPNHCNGGCSVALCSHVPQPFAGRASVVNLFVGLLGLIIVIFTFKVLLWSFLCYFVDNIFSSVFMKGRQIWFCWEDDAGVSTYLSWENSGS
jgi:hypothetical protein